jgi:hypothetical protein
MAVFLTTTIDSLVLSPCSELIEAVHAIVLYFTHEALKSSRMILSNLGF